MGRIEEMLLRNALIMTGADGRKSYLEGSALSGSLVVRNADGWVTHRVEKAANGVDFVVRNMATGMVEERISY
ncbi:hypothetical protein IJI02_00255 [Candidatus Saccharibacteria bacterium]|nr:hypothetical protein [Candidatus Saccharibacteria bacterium]